MRSPTASTVAGLTHRAGLFGSATELRDIVVPPLEAAFANADHVVVALQRAGIEAARRALGRNWGRSVQTSTPEEWFQAPGRTLAALHRLSVAHSGRRILVLAEPVLPPHHPLELREWQRLDSVLGDSLREANMDLLCLYDVRTLASSVAADIWRTHPVVLEGCHGCATTSAGYVTAAEYSSSDTCSPLPEPQGHISTVDIVADLPALRGEVEGLANRIGLPAARTSDLVIAVNELAANVVEHGPGKGTISLWRADQRVICDVSDEAGDLRDPLGGYRPTEPLSVRGYGLWITRQVCDFMEIRSTGTGSLVRLHFRI